VTGGPLQAGVLRLTWERHEEEMVMVLTHRVVEPFDSVATIEELLRLL
jgi:hypothetical protein